MSRTKRGSDKFGEAVHAAKPYRRVQRRKLLREFEREYIGRNQTPVIEL